MGRVLVSRQALFHNGGHGGSKLPPPWSNGWFAKTLFTFLGISSCKFTNYVPRGLCGLDLIPTIVWTNVDTNRALIIVIID